MDKTEATTPGITEINKYFGKDQLSREISEYYSLFDGKDASVDNPNKRQQEYGKMTMNFYDLVTDFYEYGWGESFHFACRHSKETFDQSIARCEQYIALRLGLKPGMKTLDIGCGVGGPMREIARFSGSKVIGINISEYQIMRTKHHNKRAGMEEQCESIKGDFMQMPFEDGHFETAYAIEATCHAPSKHKVYEEIMRILKPGGYFAVYEWGMTDKYDPQNQEHVNIKRGIELGNALPDIPTTKYILEAMKSVGFEIVEATDFGTVTKQNSVPWYDTLAGRISITNFRFTKVGRWMTDRMVSFLEYVKIAPQGSSATSRMLCETAEALVRGGEKEIFTPQFFVLLRKPVN